ncbi:MAG: hypothetical protein KA198_02610 [Chitinophagaceae bacterium]|nr:hypothetical protein [Chitinophagaceae bacterium]
MGKTLNQISNYPFSNGADAFDNPLLLNNSLALRNKKLQDYLNYLLEISKDIQFFDGDALASNTWYDLLKKDIVFQISSYLILNPTNLSTFLVQLPIINHFTSNVELDQDELEKLCFQRFQIIFHLFAFYKDTCLALDEEVNSYVLSIFKTDETKELFALCRHLFDECTLDIEFIKESNKVDTPDFEGKKFVKLYDGLLDSLNEFYDYQVVPFNKILNVYPNARSKFNAANEYLLSISNQVIQLCYRFNLWAEGQLVFLQTSYSAHQPHVALLISFCKLMMIYDARFNQLVQKQTSFIFEDVLKFKKKEGRADYAYVNIELAKNVDSYFLEKGTQFKAGKNSLGKQIYYESSHDINLNKGVISKIKSSYRSSLGGEMFTMSACSEANDAQWQVNGSWPLFNVNGSAETGLAFQSKVISEISEENIEISLVFEFSEKPSQIKLDLNNFIHVEIRFADLSVEKLRLKGAEFVANKIILHANFLHANKKAIHKEVNVFVKFVSPDKHFKNLEWIELFNFFNQTPLNYLGVELKTYKFNPDKIITQVSNAAIDKPFLAFGAQSFSGSSFEVRQPLLEYTADLTILLHWVEKLKSPLNLRLNDKKLDEFSKGEIISTVSGFILDEENSLTFTLNNDATHEIETTINDGTTSKVVRTPIPYPIQIKRIEFVATIREAILFEDNFNSRSQNMSDKIEGQKQKDNSRSKKHGNIIWSLFPLGYLRIKEQNNFKLLPYYHHNFSSYQADLYIGLANIVPGQTISFLFSFDEGTAVQAEKEAKIEWFYVRNNNLIQIKDYSIEDTTNHFIRTGIVRFSLPNDASSTNHILGEEELYYVVARCKEFSSSLPRVKFVKLNAISLSRNLSGENKETVLSAPPSFIEQVYPKVANIKSVNQELPTLDGLNVESTDKMFWRASMRIRHKFRSIQQWDAEHLVLEKFPEIFQIKCFNHAIIDLSTGELFAKAGNTLLLVIPYQKLNMAAPNFQPSLSLSVLRNIRSFLQNQTSAFNLISVMNVKWDVCEISAVVMLNPDCLDIGFYQEKLQMDIQYFFAPWAFDTNKQLKFASQVIYLASIVDYIDELSYVHHIRDLKVSKNGVPQSQSISLTSEVHLFTSAAMHPIKAELYVD